MVQKNKTTLSVGILDLLEGPHNYRRAMTAALLLLFTYLNVNHQSVKVFYTHLCAKSASRSHPLLYFCVWRRVYEGNCVTTVTHYKQWTQSLVLCHIPAFKGEVGRLEVRGGGGLGFQARERCLLAASSFNKSVACGEIRLQMSSLSSISGCLTGAWWQKFPKKVDNKPH